MQSCCCWVSICAVFSWKHLKSLSMSLSVYSRLSSTELHQCSTWTSGVCMQVASKHNRNPGFSLDETEIALSLWDWSTPQWFSRSRPSFSPAVFSSSLSPPLSQLSLLIFSPRNWALNSISWIYSFCTSPFLPSLDLPTSGIRFSSWEKEALGELGKGQMQLWFSLLQGKQACLEICTALCLPWLQHCGGRAEVKNQNPCWALACLNTVQEVWIAWSWGPCWFLANTGTVLIQKSQCEKWRADNVFGLLEEGRYFVTWCTIQLG